jgi:hypothetical protein
LILFPIRRKKRRGEEGRGGEEKKKLAKTRVASELGKLSLCKLSLSGD